MVWTHVKNSFRLTRIGLTMARYDALFIFRELGFSGSLVWLCTLFSIRSKQPRGERLARALEALGPTFIKLGQMLSTRADLVGEDIALALSDLRDNLPPFDAIRARNMIETELGKPLDELFAGFGKDAVAAASIAQVHRATLPNGAEVAVKILRPGIRRAFARDLELFYWIARLVDARLPAMRRLKPVQIVDIFRDSVALELDLRYEAAAATKMGANIAEDTGFRVPAIFWQMTSESVMVTEWVEGIPISDVPALIAHGHDPRALIAKLSENFFKHAFRDGFFHADMHPGNLFVDATGDIIAVDFGIMGTLDERSRLYVAEILRGFLNEDYAYVAEVHFRAGYVPAHQSRENFALACMAIAKPILDRPLNEISIGRLLGQLFNITDTFQMETRPELLLLQKTLVVVEGVGRMLDPNLNMWEVARSPIEAWANNHFSPQARLKQAARHGSDTLKHLPQFMERVDRSLSLLGDPRGLKLHPDSLIHIKGINRRARNEWLFFAWTALAAAVVLWVMG